jgi:thiamine biosynthesis lipoprotein
MRWSREVVAVVAATLFMVSSAECQSPPSVYKKKYVMGTVFEVLAYDDSPQRAAAAIDAALREAVRLDEVMSNYKPDSDLSRLNRTAHFHAQHVSPDLYRVIAESLEYSKLSQGEFDITVGPLVNYWKSVMRGGQSISKAELEKLRACTGYEKVSLVPPDQVEFRSPCLQIDLGAIGKGFAVDRMVEILRSNGVSSAFVNAGGSTNYGLGPPPHESGWRVRVRDPSGKIAPEVVLVDNSVSTSEQTGPDLLGNNKAGHIVDPETGEPAKTSAAVSAIAKTATASDALSTTLLLLGPKRSATLIHDTAGTAAIWISSTGEIDSMSNGPLISFIRDIPSNISSQSTNVEGRGQNCSHSRD